MLFIYGMVITALSPILWLFKIGYKKQIKIDWCPIVFSASGKVMPAHPTVYMNRSGNCYSDKKDIQSMLSFISK